MSQFDETTQRQAAENGYTPKNLFLVPFMNGRSSARESLEILARAVDHWPCGCTFRSCLKCDAIAQVKARGDWPLEDK